MNLYPTTTNTIAILSLVLLGWIISDFQIKTIVDTAYVKTSNETFVRASKVDLSEATASPDIATNWFTGNSSSVASQLPVGQTRKSDEDEHVAQGRILGESFGNDRP